MTATIPGRSKHLPEILATYGWSVEVTAEGTDRLWLVAERGSTSLAASWLRDEDTRRWRNSAGYHFHAAEGTLHIHDQGIALRLAACDEATLVASMVSP